MPPKQRRSRTDKLHAILEEVMGATKETEKESKAPVAPMTAFQSGFYEELRVCKGPMCEIYRRQGNLLPRAQVIGYMVKMRGGSDELSNEEVQEKLNEIFGKVGLVATFPPKKQNEK